MGNAGSKQIRSQNDISLKAPEDHLKMQKSENVDIIPPSGSIEIDDAKTVEVDKSPLKENYLNMPRREIGKVGTFNTAIEGSHVEMDDEGHISDADMHIEIASNVNV